MNNVQNGRLVGLDAAGIHSGPVGAQLPDAADAELGAHLIVAFRPNVSRAKAKAGMIVTVDAAPMEVLRAEPSPFAHGFIRLLLKEVPA